MEITGVADPFGMVHWGAAAAGIVCETPGPETVQDPLDTFDAVQDTVEVCPARTRFGTAVMSRTGVPEHEPSETVALAEQDPPAPVQERR